MVFCQAGPDLSQSHGVSNESLLDAQVVNVSLQVVQVSVTLGVERVVVLVAVVEHADYIVV